MNSGVKVFSWLYVVKLYLCFFQSMGLLDKKSLKITGIKWVPFTVFEWLCLMCEDSQKTVIKFQPVSSGTSPGLLVTTS